MSGTFPVEPGFSKTELESNQAENEVYAESAKRQSRILGGHLWRAKCSFDTMPKLKMKQIFAFCAKQRGDSFLIGIPPHENATGTISGTVLTNGTATAGDEVLAINGMGATDTFLAGDVFTLATHTKVYMVTDDAVAVAGAVTVNITPPLIEDVPDNTALTYDGVKFTMALTGGVKSYRAFAPELSTYSVSMAESIL